MMVAVRSDQDKYKYQDKYKHKYNDKYKDGCNVKYKCIQIQRQRQWFISRLWNVRVTLMLVAVKP